MEEIHINVGSYEGKISGFAATDLHHFDTLYSFVSSSGSIKDLYRQGRFLLVGGFEEVIKVYDINRRKEVSLLEAHTGTINRIVGHQGFIFTGGEDGAICVWKSKSWDMLHKFSLTSSIVDLCIHESGKILISATKDHRIQLWDLMNLTRLCVKKFKFTIYKVHIINKDGEIQYLLFQSDRKMYFVDCDSNKVVQTIDFTNPITDSILLEQNSLIIADSIGQIHLVKIQIDEETLEHIEIMVFKAHAQRIKQVKQFISQEKGYLCTISSDGEIKIWDCLQYADQQFDEIDLKDQLKPIYEIKMLQRLTCLDIYQGEKLKENQEIIKEEIPKEEVRPKVIPLKKKIKKQLKPPTQPAGKNTLHPQINQKKQNNQKKQQKKKIDHQQKPQQNHQVTTKASTQQKKKIFKQKQK